MNISSFNHRALALTGAVSVVFLLGCDGGTNFHSGSNRVVSRPMARTENQEKVAEISMPSSTPVVIPSDLSLMEKIPLQYEIVSDLINIVLVVDDSSSMESKQQALAKGLVKTLDNLKGKNVEVFLYSTSAFTNLIPFFQGNTINSYSIPALYSGGPRRTFPGFYHGDTFYSGSKLPFLTVEPTVVFKGVESAPASKILDFIPEKAITKYVLSKSGFSTPSGSIRFQSGMSDAAFNAAITQLKAEVMLGDTGQGAERPLCTIGHLVQNEGRYKIFSPGARGVFVILTDEDDNGDCINTTETTVAPYAAIPATAFHQESWTVMDYGSKIDDAGAGRFKYDNPWLQMFHTECKTNPLCEPARGFPAPAYSCTAAQRSAYLAWFNATYKSQIDAGKMILSPTAKCTSYNQHSYRKEAVSLPFNYNPSMTFTKDGVIYPNVVEYFRARYPKDMFTGEMYLESNIGAPKHTHSTFPGLSSPSDLPAWIRTKATNLFGADNFAVSVIANIGADNSPGCDLDPAKRSNEVLKIADVKSSICAGDYSDSLKWIEQFSSKRLSRDIPVDQKYLNGSYDFKLVSETNIISLGKSDYEIDVAGSMVHLVKTPSIAETWWLAVFAKK
ncbi:MAG: hypothetical protein NTV34_13770 [Proteobacteria bacterium]|nr:hypothetical protein [Pseudomonadota bacterium]